MLTGQFYVDTCLVQQLVQQLYLEGTLSSGIVGHKAVDLSEQLRFQNGKKFRDLSNKTSAFIQSSVINANCTAEFLSQERSMLSIDLIKVA